MISIAVGLNRLETDALRLVAKLRRTNVKTITGYMSPERISSPFFPVNQSGNKKNNNNITTNAFSTRGVFVAFNNLKYEYF